MGYKGDWNREAGNATYRANLEAIQANEKRRRERLAKALELTGGRVVKKKGEK